VEKRVVETKVEWRDRIVVQKEDRRKVTARTQVKVKPDGTRTQTQTVVTEERRSDSVARDTLTSVGQRVEGTREASNSGVAPLRNYSLHLGYAPVARSGADAQRWQLGGFGQQQFLVGAGARLGGLPAFGTATAVWPVSNSFLRPFWCLFGVFLAELGASLIQNANSLITN
jgi:hypothetical protein